MSSPGATRICLELFPRLCPTDSTSTQVFARLSKRGEGWLQSDKRSFKKRGKLLRARSVREVQYPDWLANIVLVKKRNNKWRLCVVFMDLNKACPKDYYPLPRIDLLVDATANHSLMSFIDAYSGYN